MNSKMHKPPMTIEDNVRKDRHGKEYKPGPLTYWPGGVSKPGEDRTVERKRRPSWLVPVLAGGVVIIFIFFLKNCGG